MTRKATVSISLIHVLLNYASSKGIDIVKVYQSINFPKEKLNDPEMRISASQFYALWSHIEEQAEDQDFGLHVAESSRNRFDGDILGAVMLNCPTVGSAMEKMIRYHDLSTDVVQLKLIQEKDQALYAWESTLEDGVLDRQISEAIICRIFFTLEILSNEKMSFAKIHFRHPRPEKVAEHQRIFGYPVFFNQNHNAVVIQADILDLPIPLANPKLLIDLEQIIQKHLESLYNPNTWSEKVSQEISRILLDGKKPTIKLVAKKLAISIRHLQNMLKAEGVKYRSLLDQVRKEMALSYLKEPRINIIDTAFLLGFSDQSAFNHAFKRWTGKTPGEFQN